MSRLLRRVQFGLDLDQFAEPLAVDELQALVDDEEPAVARHAFGRQIDLGRIAEAERLDRV